MKYFFGYFRQGAEMLWLFFFQLRIKRGSMPKCKPLGQFYFDHLKTSQVEKFCRRMIKKLGIFFGSKLCIYEWVEIFMRLIQLYIYIERERERESEQKKLLRLFCFTQDLVYNFSQATLIISVGFCNSFWYTHLG